MRPSPAQLQNQPKLINVIQSALAGHDSLLDNLFSHESSVARRGSSNVNASLSFHAKPRCSHDYAENGVTPSVFRRLLYEEPHPKDGPPSEARIVKDEAVDHPKDD